MADISGQQLGQYVLLSKLGEGGMASVYRARQTSMNRDIAIKVIESKLAGNPEFLRRFEREAHTIAGLSHPHILKVYDFGRQGDLLYLVMELLPGGSLVSSIREGNLPLQAATRLIEQIGEALDYAHSKGVIHRDLKPQNVLLDERGNAILTDFGIAKVLVAENTALTQSGMVMGTPAYMAPEQWQNRGIDARADVYAFGIMIYEILAGHVPFAADTPFQMMHAHIYEPPPSIRSLRPDLPAQIEGVIARALNKDPNLRFQTAGELTAAFKLALTGQTPPGLAMRSTPATGWVAPSQPTFQTSVPPPTPTRRGVPLSVFVGVIALVVIAALIAVLSITNRPSPANAPTETTAPGVAQAQPQTLTSTPTATSTATSTPSRTLTATLSATPSLGADLLTLTAQAQKLNSLSDVLTSEAQRQTDAAKLTSTAQIIAQTKAANEQAQAAIQATILALSFTPTFTPSKTSTSTRTFTPTATSTPTNTPTVTPTLTPAPASANSQWKPIVQTFDGVEMVRVPSGCFMMGSENGEDDEKPVTKICFDKAFWIDKTEVTQIQFRQFDGMAANEPRFSANYRPVENITWFEARDFCAKRGARLPTEAEWEYAARGPDNLVYPWGNEWDETKAVQNRDDTQGTAIVGSIESGKSWVGAFDLSGNVREWVNSIYAEYPYNARDGREDFTNATSAYVLRGGSWNSNAASILRAAYRTRGLPSGTYPVNGFRCARPS